MIVFVVCTFLRIFCFTGTDQLLKKTALPTLPLVQRKQSQKSQERDPVNPKRKNSGQVNYHISGMPVGRWCFMIIHDVQAFYDWLSENGLMVEMHSMYQMYAALIQ